VAHHNDRLLIIRGQESQKFSDSIPIEDKQADGNPGLFAPAPHAITPFAVMKPVVSATRQQGVDSRWGKGGLLDQRVPGCSQFDRRSSPYYA